MQSKPTIIIGSGLAGYTLARDLRAEQPASAELPLTIITADNGEYYYKPLLSNALTHKKTPEQIITLAAPEVAQKLDAEIITNSAVIDINPAEQVITIENKQENERENTQQNQQQNNLDNKQENKQTIEYKNLVIAWGAEAKKPQLVIDTAIDPADDKAQPPLDIHSINNLDDYRKFYKHLKNKQHITLLGAGLINCELANDLLNNDYQVEIITNASSPIANLLPPAVGEILANCLSRLGATWHWNTGIEQIAGHTITLSNSVEFSTDLLVSAIGLQAKTRLAQQIPLSINRGIIVDQYLQTSQPNIYALGDCAEIFGQVSQHVLPITYAAKALAKTLTGNLTPVNFPVMPVTIKTPACPIVVAPPPENAEGSWNMQNAGKHLKATYVNQHNEILGFVLTGDRTRERLELMPLINHKARYSSYK